MSFVYPWSLLLLILIAPVIVFFIWRSHVRRRMLQKLGNDNLLRALAPGFSQQRCLWQAALSTITLAALVIALARPLWGVDLDIIEIRGTAVIVVLDVSRSMNASDTKPSRLERAKIDISDLFQALTGHQVGLVLFAGSAYLQFPLTTDTETALSFLKAANSNAITRQGTAIETALRLAATSFDERSSAHRVIVLASDGEYHDGNPLAAAAEAAQQGIQIHAIGYGDTSGEPIPVLDGTGRIIGYQEDTSGQLILSALNESALQGVAARGGGFYQRTGQGIEQIADAINRLETQTLESRTQNRGIERAGFFIGLGLAALALRTLLSETRRVVS
jgi:Ca-activated chloride channel family protein